MRSMSARRRSEQAERAKVREIVIERAGGECQYAEVIDWVSCGTLPDRSGLEVDELRGGSFRSTEYLDPEACRATCPRHHEYKTSHKNEVLRLLAIHEGREP